MNFTIFYSSWPYFVFPPSTDTIAKENMSVGQSHSHNVCTKVREFTFSDHPVANYEIRVFFFRWNFTDSVQLSLHHSWKVNTPRYNFLRADHQWIAWDELKCEGCFFQIEVTIFSIFTVKPSPCVCFLQVQKSELVKLYVATFKMRVLQKHVIEKKRAGGIIEYRV